MSIILLQKVTPLKCHRCNHIWNYKGKNGYVATCPHCRTYVTLKRHTIALFGQQKQLSIVKGVLRKLNDSRNSKDSNRKIDNPVKKCHYLEGKHFIVFDESILQKAGIVDDELYFLQGVTDDGCIILRPYRLKEINDV